MTKEELVALLRDNIIPKANAGVLAFVALRDFSERLYKSIEDSSPVSQVLDQADIDELITIYTPPYLQLLADIEDCADALATDDIK